ncbi:undecaprenyl-diphosphate phosphatase [Candidatus Persebacteraceae bacterium Df01]|jgi:undecaprenyl-diphosphatase|uniref:Undecaprenyl-diphosphatase n=1 Tax=Candidatus Doriopsillibacter californiensis TaxID=2970740 RepID=A0ABT7QN32_9GAMM|nr:undecaprenyl-diphosphate phosphatase [Candidatus Persebacteraceae bacterium Df01]
MGDAAHWVNIIILGIVEGVTEFLPVSSTGHLIITAHWLGENSAGGKLFEVVIQLGAIVAVCYEFRARLLQMARDWRGEATRRMAVNLTLAFLPAAILGLLLYDTIKLYLFSPVTVALALIVGGVVIIWAERRPRASRIMQMEELRPRDALVVGLCQTLSLFPGVSRAGATIIGAMLWGVERRTATEFSFFLALPVMFAASGYDLWKSRDLLNWQLAGDIALGFVVSFVSALLVIRVLLRYVSRHNFTPFGWYRIIFGLLVLAVFAS